jgi:hypothetical protein
MVEGFWWLVQLAAGCGFGRGTTLVATALVEPAPLALLPGGGGVVSCQVRCPCVLFVCGGVSFGL